MRHNTLKLYPEKVPVCFKYGVAIGARASKEATRLPQCRGVAQQIDSDRVALHYLVAHVRVLQTEISQVGKRGVHV